MTSSWGDQSAGLTISEVAALRRRLREIAEDLQSGYSAFAAGLTDDRGELQEALSDQLQTIGTLVAFLLDQAHEPVAEWPARRQELLTSLDPALEAIREAFDLLHDALSDDRPAASLKGPVADLEAVERDLFLREVAAEERLRGQPRDATS